MDYCLFTHRELGSWVATVYQEQGLPATLPIVEQLAKIPLLIPTLLIIRKYEDEAGAKAIMDLPIMRRVIFNKFTVISGNTTTEESWILGVLHSKEESSAQQTLKNQRKVIDYLERISKLNLWDYSSVFLSTEHQQDYYYSKERQLVDLFDEPEDLQRAFLEQRNELFEEISNIQRLIPLLFALPNEDVERASELTVIQNALHNAVRRKFMVAQVR
jgi:hypothetical protein